MFVWYKILTEQQQQKLSNSLVCFRNRRRKLKPILYFISHPKRKRNLPLIIRNHPYVWCHIKRIKCHPIRSEQRTQIRASLIKWGLTWIRLIRQNVCPISMLCAFGFWLADKGHDTTRRRLKRKVAGPGPCMCVHAEEKRCRVPLSSHTFIYMYMCIVYSTNGLSAGLNMRAIACHECLPPQLIVTPLANTSRYN